MKFALATVASAISASTLVSAHSRYFGVAKPSFFNSKSLQQVQQIANAISLESAIKLPRGGADDAVEGEEAEEVKLYLPGLLQATVSGKWVSSELHMICLFVSSYNFN